MTEGHGLWKGFLWLDEENKRSDLLRMKRDPSHNSGPWYLYIVLLKNTETDEVRLFHDYTMGSENGRPYSEDEMDSNVLYQWTDGNYGCSCNRLIFFGVIASSDNTICGDKRVRVSITNPRTGKVVLNEFN